MTRAPNTKPSGGDAPEGPCSLDELVDEASEGSFPCSDPPAFTSLHAGAPAAVQRRAEPDRRSDAASETFVNRLRRRIGRSPRRPAG